MLDAYDKARLDGYTGTINDFHRDQYLSGGIEAAKAAGFAGTELDIQDQILEGRNGVQSPYDLAVAYGYRGTAKQWLEQLRGQDGAGVYELAIANGFEGTPDDFLRSLAGRDGLDAYEVARTEGFDGTAAEWLKQLQGAPGEIGPMPAHEWDGTRIRFEQLPGVWGEWVDVKGIDGTDGKDGKPGRPGQMPDHQIEGRRIRFERPDGRWGAWIDMGIGAPGAGFGGGGGGGGGGGSLQLQQFYASSSEFPAQGKKQILYFSTAAVPYPAYVWDGTQYRPIGGDGDVGSVKQTFETIAQNLRAKDGALTYTPDGDLASIVYSDGITKSFGYSPAGDLITITLSGSVPLGIALTKSLSYDAEGNLSGMVYT